MATRRANFLLSNINKRIDTLDTDKAKRLEEKKLKEQKQAEEERIKSRLERDEQMLKRMSFAREERQDKEKKHIRQRQLFRGRGRQYERTRA